MAHSGLQSKEWRTRFAAAAMVAALVLCFWPAGFALADTQIGSAAVVVNNVTGTIASTQQRSVLRAGIDVFQNEVIDTADGSASRVVFQDRTDLQIGPASRVTLDRFVYNPDPSQSQVALSVLRGVARFSTGVLPKPNYALRTPSAAIGIRGTVLTMTVTPANLSTISVESGVAAVTGAGVTVTVNPGYSTQVAQGSPPSQPYPTPASPAVTQMDTLLASAPAAPPGGPPPGGPSPGGQPPGNGPPPGYGQPDNGDQGGSIPIPVPGFGFGGGYGGGFGNPGGGTHSPTTGGGNYGTPSRGR
jgi:outer membrane immunogenic protein